MKLVNANIRSANSLVQGRPTRNPRATFGPLKDFEWPAVYFLKLSVPSILAEIEDRSDIKTPFFVFQVLEITTILGQKVENLTLISGKNLLFFLEITMISRQKVENVTLISLVNTKFLSGMKVVALY